MLLQKTKVRPNKEPVEKGFHIIVGHIPPIRLPMPLEHNGPCPDWLLPLHQPVAALRQAKSYAHACSSLVVAVLLEAVVNILSPQMAFGSRYSKYIIRCQQRTCHLDLLHNTADKE